MVDYSDSAFQCGKRRFGGGAHIWRTFVRFCAHYFFRVNCAFVHTCALYGFLKPRNVNQCPRSSVEHRDGRGRFKPDHSGWAPTRCRGPELSTINRGSTSLARRTSCSSRTHPLGPRRWPRRSQPFGHATDFHLRLPSRTPLLDFTSLRSDP